MVHPRHYQDPTQPATPVNCMSTSLEPPLTPSHVPLPPSASNFLNQNYFSPSHNVHFDTYRDPPPHLNRRSSRCHFDPNPYAYNHSAGRHPYPQPEFFPRPFYPPLYNPPHYPHPYQFQPTSFAPTAPLFPM